jgi:RimJ/RimL family protein N-acetyltransferase
MSHLTYIRILSENDVDIPLLINIHKIPEISQYISINKNYWHYISNTPNVYFYKVYHNDNLISSIHLEIQNNILFMDILVFPQYQKLGFGTRIIKDIQNDIFNLNYKKIEISIDEANEKSLNLFKKEGFEYLSQDKELLNFVYYKH